jgi:hypothetical protein
MLIKQGATGPLPFVWIDLAGSTPTSYQLVKGDGSFSVGTGTITSGGTGGVYYLTLAAGESNVLGFLAIFVQGTSTFTVSSDAHQVVAFDPEDATALGLGNLNASVGSRGTANPGDAMDLIPGALTAIAAAVVANTLNLADGVDTGCTLADALKTMVAILTGKEDTVAGVTSFLNWAETKTRVQTAASPGGNRTAPTLDLT